MSSSRRALLYYIYGSHKSYTLPFENRKNIKRLCLSPNNNILLSIDEEGGCLLINFNKKVLLSHFLFKKEVKDIKFSNDGKYIAVTYGRQIQIYRTPSLICQFASFNLIHTISGHSNDVISLQWVNSYYILSSSKDNTCRLTCIDPVMQYAPFLLGGHKDSVLSCFYSKVDKTIYTVSTDGALFVWKWTDFEDRKFEKPEFPDPERDEFLGGRFKIERKVYFNTNYVKVTCASYHLANKAENLSLLVVGFSNGVFELYSLPDATSLQSLSVSKYAIDTVSISPSGEWLAFGSAILGQLLIWEWQSETYVIKQQGHFHDINAVAYSPDGQLIATGGDDGKVKLWNASNGFCFITFSEHTAPVTSVAFSNSGTVVLSASLDGTVRAFDLVRYRNFRTLTGPSLLPFTTVAVEASNEIVCAGTRDSFQVCVWQLQTGKLLEVLSGHEGPISGLAFSPTSQSIASCSWDLNVRVWDLNSGQCEILPHNTMVMAVNYRPDGKEICSAGLNAQLHFWDVETSELKFTIEGREDVRGGRKKDDFRTAQNSTGNCTFTSVCYSADGTCVIACGESKFVCIYELKSRLLLKKFCLSKNQTLDGIAEMLNSRLQTETGLSLDMYDLEDENDDKDRALEKFDVLPGVQKGDFSSRKTRPTIRAKSVAFSPNGQYWCAASTEGLVIYSLDGTFHFDPFDLDIEITPKNIRKTIAAGQYAKGLVMALRLAERSLIIFSLEQIPTSEVALIVKAIPLNYFENLLNLLSIQLVESPHMEFYLLWIKNILFTHGEYLQSNRNQYATVFKAIQNSLTKQYTDFSKICNDNQYQLDYLCSIPTKSSTATA